MKTHRNSYFHFLAIFYLTAFFLATAGHFRGLPWAGSRPNEKVALAQGEEPTPTEESDDNLPVTRPILVVKSYQPDVDGGVTGGSDVELEVVLHNTGSEMAFNVVVTFTPGDFVPRVTGGVVALEEMDPGEKHRIRQPFSVSWGVVGKSFANVVMNVSYSDIYGKGYAETFNINVPVAYRSGAYATATPTPTATPLPVIRPQMVINGYYTDLESLQPGSRFNLSLDFTNVGNATAKRLTMILGGGSSSSGGAEGTPEPGGVSGGSGDLATFAPVAASNVQFIGDLPAGDSGSAVVPLIVNASANPGAYPLKISFTYSVDGGGTFTDDQVVTLLVYSPPLVEVNFYRDPGPLFAGQPNQLPLQVVNLGRKAAVLGNMTVQAQGAQLTNNTTLVGALDTGGYFTLDTNVIPDQPGALPLIVSLDYRDDFNQSQVITKTITVEVMESPAIEPSPGGEIPDGVPGESAPPAVSEPATETLWQKVGRFLRGLIGLDSGQPTPAPEEFPPEIPPGEFPPGRGVSSGKTGPGPH